jgi:ferric-dicitrate binding protein FerR (iron transport regulator)
MQDKNEHKEDKRPGAHKGSVASELYRLLSSMDLPDAVAELCEELREPILRDIYRRIDNLRKRKLRAWLALAAASVALLMVVSNSYFYRKGLRQQSAQIIEVSNLLGMRSTIMLPDSTMVTLNAGTTLAYPTLFTGKEREVRVEGEAFFEVKPDPQKAFIVKADRLKVQVTGTSFNVKGYPDEATVEVTIVSGSVKVNAEDMASLAVLPSQQVVFDKYSKAILRRTVNLKHYTSWKEGKFYFNERSLSQIARQLERSFNVNIDIASEELKSVVFSGDFVRGEGIEQILRVMAADRRLKCTFDGDSIVIDTQR